MGVCSGGGGAGFAEFLAMEVRVHTGEVLSGTSEVVLEVEGTSVSCGDLLDDLMSECEQDPSRREAWLLEEDWNGCSKTLISSSTSMFTC